MKQVTSPYLGVGAGARCELGDDAEIVSAASQRDTQVAVCRIIGNFNVSVGQDYLELLNGIADEASSGRKEVYSACRKSNISMQ